MQSFWLYRLKVVAGVSKLCNILKHQQYEQQRQRNKLPSNYWIHLSNNKPNYDFVFLVAVGTRPWILELDTSWTNSRRI